VEGAGGGGGADGAVGLAHVLAILETALGREARDFGEAHVASIEALDGGGKIAYAG
jgi:hypothetical protein